MVKTPEFDERRKFGANWEEPPPLTPVESIRITEGAVVDLRYKGKTASIRVTKVVQPQAEFEGTIEAFDRHEQEHGSLKYGDVVRLSYDKIEHINKWIKADQA